MTGWQCKEDLLDGVGATTDLGAQNIQLFRLNKQKVFREAAYVKKKRLPAGTMPGAFFVLPMARTSTITSCKRVTSRKMSTDIVREGYAQARRGPP